MKVRKKVGERVFSVLLAAMTAFSMAPATAFGTEVDAITSSVSQFTDMPDNWSAKALQNAVANGLLSGADGRIMPDQNLTRAQMAAVITRAFGAQVKGDLSGFTDVKAADWFSDGLAKAYQMGVIKGSGSLMNPNSAISRQEVFVILARAFKLQPAETMDKPFGDAGNITDWAKGEVNAFVNAGYVQGSNGKLNPAGLITRAEFAQIFDNLLKQYIGTAGEYSQAAAGNIMINAPGVTLKGLTVNGDLIVGDGVGDGEVTLDSVAITGRLVIRGGGEHSIIIKGSSSVSKVVVARVDGAVSVRVEGDAEVEVVYIDDGSDDVSVQGTFGDIEVAAPEIVVKTINATIGKLDIAGEGTKVVVEAGSKVETVTIHGQNTQITGTGTVTRVEAQAGATGSKIETPNTQISVGAGVTGVTAGGGTKVDPGTSTYNDSTATGTTGATAQPPSSGNTGGHHDNPTPSVSVTDISVTSDTTVTFNCDVAGAAVTWNGTPISGYATVVGVNTVTIPAAAIGSTNKLEVSRSGYTGYSNSTVYRNLVKDTAELAAALASNVPTIKFGANMILTGNFTVNREVTVDGNGYSVNQTVAVTADNVTIKNLKGTLNTKTQHGLSGIGSATAFYIKAKNVVLDGVTVNGSAYSPAYKDEPTIGIIGFDTASFTVKNSNLSGLLTGIFPHIGYTLGAQNTFTATGNTFTDVYAGIGGTEKTDATITGNTFVSVKAGGEGIGLGAGVVVNGAALDAYKSYLESQNTFSYSAGSEAKVKDYRPAVGVVTNARNFTITSLALNGWTFKLGNSTLVSTESGAGPYTYTVTIPSGTAPLTAGENIIIASKANYPDSTVIINYEGTTVSDTAGLLAAISGAADGDTIYLASGTYELSGKLSISKAISLLGKGSVTIKPAAAAVWGTGNTDKHLIGIYSGTASSPVKFQNIAFDSSNKAYGLNTYANSYGVLNNVTITNSKGAGLTVNGSTIDAKNLNTSNNSWGAVNVDPGDGVTIPSKFVLTGNGALSEEKQIWSDGDNVKASAPNATVTVSAIGYDGYRIYDSVKDKDGNPDNDDSYIWTNRDLKNTIVLETGSKKVIYPDIYTAVDDAASGDTVLIEAGTYNLDSALTIQNAITVKGADKNDTILIGTCRFTSGSPGATITLNGGATLENLTVKRDNTGDWATNYNNSLISLSNLTANTTVQDCIITQGRNGIYMNNTYKISADTATIIPIIPIIRDNIITDNRTGINFCGDCSHAEITGNTITDNWTIGIVTYSNSSHSSDLGTVELTNNTIKGNWIAQILIKYDTSPPNTTLPPAGSGITGTWIISDNIFDSPVTIARQYNQYKAEPAYNDQQPESAEGTVIGNEDKKPTWVAPTIRIYNQPDVDVDYKGSNKTTLPVYDESQ